MKEESQKSKLVKMVEDFEKAKLIVEECKRNLVEKKKLIDAWKNRVDRPCIERIRAFQNPPALIGQIMDMVMVLIGKKKHPESILGTREATGTQRDKEERQNTESAKLSSSKTSTLSKNNQRIE